MKKRYEHNQRSRSVHNSPSKTLKKDLKCSDRIVLTYGSVNDIILPLTILKMFLRTYVLECHRCLSGYAMISVSVLFKIKFNKSIEIKIFILFLLLIFYFFGKFDFFIQRIYSKMLTNPLVSFMYNHFV